VILETQLMGVLRRVAALRRLSRQDLIVLSEAAEEVAMPAGSIVQYEGQATAHAAVIVDGIASLWLGGRQVGEVGPGAFVANRPPLGILTRNARVIAQTPMRLLALPVDVLANMLDETAVTAAVLDAGLARLRRRGESGSCAS
jgi:CRP-like cAMP-binding protein